MTIAHRNQEWVGQSAIVKKGVAPDVTVPDDAHLEDLFGPMPQSGNGKGNGHAETEVLLLNGRYGIGPLREAMARASRDTIKICLVTDTVFSLEKFAELYTLGVRIFSTLPLSASELDKAMASAREGNLFVSELLSLKLISGAGLGSDHAGWPKLSEREREVLGLLLKGFNTKTIARSLNVSVRTVEAHRLSIRKKTGGSSYAQLAMLL